METLDNFLKNFWNKVEDRLKFLEECHAFYIILEKVIFNILRNGTSAEVSQGISCLLHFSGKDDSLIKNRMELVNAVQFQAVFK